MHVIHACGCRGLGDIVSGTSNIIRNLKQDSHIIFHFPPGFDYKTTFDTLMSEFTIPEEFKVTYEVDETWYTIDKRKARRHFSDLTPDIDWFFFASGGTKYIPFKTQWLGDVNGPIAIAPNNENTNIYYPYPGKWFPEKVNKLITDLIDEKKYLHLGKPFTVKECIDKMARCRYVVGVDGAWAHVANAMNVPYILVRNDFREDILHRLHYKNPTLTSIETYQVLEYLVL